MKVFGRCTFNVILFTSILVSTVPITYSTYETDPAQIHVIAAKSESNAVPPEKEISYEETYTESTSPCPSASKKVVYVREQTPTQPKIIYVQRKQKEPPTLVAVVKPKPKGNIIYVSKDGRGEATTASPEPKAKIIYVTAEEKEPSQTPPQVVFKSAAEPAYVKGVGSRPVEVHALHY